MALTPGTRLGPYEIVEAIGAGGMGEVYRAHDTKLGRDVALKILPEVFAGDADRLARFEREARTLASLDHPNIATVYGFEEGAGVHALVMELIEGEDLSERLARGPVPMDEALPIARQVAEALEAAHDAGVVHRDLKPANVKIRLDGTVRVIDFGLAKAMGPAEASGSAATNAPTMTSPAMTEAGIILGTAAYMSPEQAKGKRVDRRADIWAFGALLFEMLTGQAAFGGESLSERLAAVLKEEPDWQALPVRPSSPVHRLMRRCLTKDVRRRLQAIGDARVEIEEVLSREGESEDQAVTAAPAPPSGLRRLALPGLALLAVTGWALVFVTGGPPPDPPELRLSVPPPVGESFASLGAGTVAPHWDLSPDGRQMVFASDDADGVPRLWLRALADAQPRLLPGTAGAERPFWSPDGQTVGFTAGRQLLSTPVVGGTPRVIANLSVGNVEATWGSRGVIVFTEDSRLVQVSAEGGSPVPVDIRTPEDSADTSPSFLPDGQRFLFMRTPQDGARAVYVGSLDGSEPNLLVESDFPAFYVEPGFLVYIRDSTLVAQSLEDNPLRLTGEPRAVVDDVALNAVPGNGAYRVATDGTVSYRARSFHTESRLLVMDRSGSVVGNVGPTGPYIAAEYSPSRRRAAISRQVSLSVENEEPDSEIVWRDLVRDVEVTVVADNVRSAENPIWSPDEQSLAYAAHPRGGTYAETRIRLASGSGAEEVVASGAENFHPHDWSPDGRYLLLQTFGQGRTGLWTLDLEGDRVPAVYVDDAASDEGMGRFSPDGRWVAYTSTRSTRPEVYVEPFPAGGDRVQVSAAGGGQPQWSPNGRELFYVTPDGTLMAVPVAFGETFAAGTPLVLFRTAFPETDFFYYGGMGGYTVGENGERFLVNSVIRKPGVGPLIVVLNWRRPDER
jgi:serine/threonine protein kinase/Tol biopolymer transport system component